MKRYLLLITVLFVIGFGFNSCDEQFLDVDPVSSLTYGAYWTSEEAARVAMTGLHATFRDNDAVLFLLGDVRSDLYGGPGFEQSFNEIFVFHDIRTENAPLGNWAGFYTDLHRINEAIKYIPTVQFTNEQQKNYLIGQAYGMRAYYYYTMVRTWGGVPLVLEPTESIDFMGLAMPRASEQEIFNQIKSDLEASMDAFGGQNNFRSRSQWSMAATLVLKGDVYIWTGTHLGGGAADYQVAKSTLQEVVNLPGLALLDDYSSVFSYNNKSNSEIIFAFHHERDQRSSGFHSQMLGRMTELMNTYTENGELLGTGLALSGANRYHPNEDNLAVLFEDHPLDQRAAGTWLRLFRDPAATELGGVITTKFMGTLAEGVRFSIDDQPVYRYAYAIILLAEAKNLLGEDPSPEINRLRQRAYRNNYDPAIHGHTDQGIAGNTDAILREHLKEFQQEGHRWWALRRAGNEYVINHVEYLNPGDEYKFLLPITRDMLGRNPALEQTPGYES